jgi:N-methylhydantoinase A/oxoprolinase/acetone carboxylase beta subunit
VRIGIDVGGTNSDAVVVDDGEVLVRHKAATTLDVTGGIVAALERVLPTARRRHDDVDAVVIGTTHFINALTERSRLLKVAVVRLALPATTVIPPMPDWPEDLRVALGEHVYLAHGGYNFDGREIAALDVDELRSIARDIRRKGIRSLALSSAFAPINDEMERRAAEVFREECPGIHISLSSDIGRIGLIERENATALNATLRDIAHTVVRSLRRALDELGLTAPLFVTQNDGTLMSATYAEQHPVLTFASGPTNSMRGAAFLSKLDDAVVVDIGGTTTDVGMLVGGYPRQAATEVDVAGVRTNFRLPDLVSIGLGGGSLVRPKGAAGAEVTVGPDSVGYRLIDEARVFGGQVLTATDVAVAAGAAVVGDVAAVSGLEPAMVDAARAEIRRLVSDAVERMKLSAAPVPVILVGGGAILVDGSIEGVSSIEQPHDADVANAIGAAIAHVGAEVDRVFSLEGTSREAVLTAARDEAMRRAVAAGAVPGSVAIVDVDEVALTYLPGNATRVRVKAVGELQPSETGRRGR